MTKSQQANMQARINAAASAMDKLAAERRERTGIEPPRWQTMEPQRPPMAWRMAA